MKRNLFLTGTILVAFILIVMPFSVSHAESTPKTLKIGCTLPLGVGLGIEAKKCLDLIIPDFNSKGGLVVGGERYNIEMIIYDDGYKPDKGRAAVERLIYQDKVKFIVGQLASPAIVAGLTPVSSCRLPWPTILPSAPTAAARKPPSSDFIRLSEPSESPLVTSPLNFST